MTPATTAADDGFRRELGLFDAVVVVAGGIVGVGIFANPSNVARIVSDPTLILLVWAIGGAVALVGGFVWAELASRFPHVGGQYVYLQRSYPPLVGFLYGVALLFIINGGSLAAVSILFASYVDRSIVTLGPLGLKAAAAAALVGLTAINAVGVRAGARTFLAAGLRRRSGVLGRISAGTRAWPVPPVHAAVAAVHIEAAHPPGQTPPARQRPAHWIQSHLPDPRPHA
jgi:APA family basic amino acid/polyamine antiporter